MNELKKIHLGCGEKYLAGYVNIDYPPSEHSVIKVRADEYRDIRTLEYPESTLDEIRSHHLFEHFSRAEALKLLLRWRRWLKPGGTLVIETPDFGACVNAYAFALSRRRRFALGRHMLGSQEAAWAYHYDFWDGDKFKFVLGALGFEDIRAVGYRNSIAQRYTEIPQLRWLASLPSGFVVAVLNILGNLVPDMWYARKGGHKLPNILVTSKRTAAAIDEPAALRAILSEYLVGREGEELLAVWLKDAGA
jgi:SAM-dependent methyltransferase